MTEIIRDDFSEAESRQVTALIDALQQMVEGFPTDQRNFALFAVLLAGITNDSRTDREAMHTVQHLFSCFQAGIEVQFEERSDANS